MQKLGHFPPESPQTSAKDRRRWVELRRRIALEPGRDVRGKLESDFRQWLAEFFVDRLKRNDIPGYRPFPPIDRFFLVEAVGCEINACEVMVAQRRWITREDLLDLGEYPDTIACTDNRAWFDKKGDLTSCGKYLLPGSAKLCEKAPLLCTRVLEAVRSKALDGPGRTTLISAGDVPDASR